MADTEKAEQPQTNGLENGLEEDERTKLRPADIDADVREMERRKRVEMIMSSKLFREELERIIELQLKDGNGPAGLLQQISDMMGIQSGKLQTTHLFRGSNCVTPINDIRGVESMGYEKGEKNLRCKLASVFRLMDLYGWSQGINNQITARLNQDEEHFLVNPHGMLFNEITASSLVKVDMQGNIVEPGTTNFSVNTQGFLLHSAIHASRPDVNCVIHIKTPSVLAVSSLKCGLLPICQESLVIGEVSQHPFVSGIFEPEEREKIIRNLGPHNKVLLLHNHGAVCCGATVEEAFYNVYNTVLACETQMKLMPMGVENLLLVNDETRKAVYDAAHRAPDTGAQGDKKKFRVGEMEFEALIRMLDNAGFRTGYIYRHPLVKGELPKPKNDVEVPPAVSSLGYLIEQEELYKQGNWKKYVDGRNRLDRTKWLNSPNVYQKVEILETGTSDPKKITKWVDQNSEEWVAESSPTHSSTPVKIESALQFVPKGTNPKEFKKLQQQIKENRRADKITSGPQSHILEGVSWEEAKKLQDANMTQTGDQVILVGAASKGIIQRNYQHNALVYKTPYAKNPFDSMSDKEIEDYKQLVERKQRGDTDYEESQSESEAISSSRQDALRHFKSPLLSPQSATSETEEESRDEPRVLRIETKTAPRPIQAEVVLSDAESDTTDARIERSHSARYPKAEKPESVTLMNSFRKSWSLKREKDKSKDVENICDSRNLLKDPEGDQMESLQCCIARVKQLTHRPVVVDLSTKLLRPLLKSASDPCNLSTLNDEDAGATGVDSSRSCGNITMSDLQQRLHVRKKLLHSAKMKFLGYHKREKDVEKKEKAPTSPMCALISEIRETISEIMSPERSRSAEDVDEEFERPRLVSRSAESGLRGKRECSRSRASLSESFASLVQSTNCDCVIHGGKVAENVEENKTEEKSDEEVTYTVTDDSLLQTYSFTESTETEWYYNKTIMKLDNSQTMLEIKDTENKGENSRIPAVKHTDTGIDTDFTSEKENDCPDNEEQKTVEQVEAEEADAEMIAGESSGLNRSSETDSSFLKSGSGRTSNDFDTSVAFKTETDSSEKSPEKNATTGPNVLQEILPKSKETVEEESSDSGENMQESRNNLNTCLPPLADIPESPEFTNIDTEDAPVTSSSKDTSPEVVANDPVDTTREADVEAEEQEVMSEISRSPEQRRKRKSSTKITVKKELKEKHSNEAVVSEIKVTIKNSTKCQSEKYEVEIQDVTNTSEELSSVGENSYESCEIVGRSCECDAQQNLEELQSEVSSTIQKLHGIENYFEDEIQKQSVRKRNGSDEFTIEYNYRELEEVLNESRDKMGDSAELWETPPNNDESFLATASMGENILEEVEILEVIDENGDCINFDREDDSANGEVSSETIGTALLMAVMETFLNGDDCEEEENEKKNDTAVKSEAETVDVAEASEQFVEVGERDEAEKDVDQIASNVTDTLCLDETMSEFSEFVDAENVENAYKRKTDKREINVVAGEDFTGDETTLGELASEENGKAEKVLGDEETQVESPPLVEEILPEIPNSEEEFENEKALEIKHLPEEEVVKGVLSEGPKEEFSIEEGVEIERPSTEDVVIEEAKKEEIVASEEKLIETGQRREENMEPKQSPEEGAPIVCNVKETAAITEECLQEIVTATEQSFEDTAEVKERTSESNFTTDQEPEEGIVTENILPEDDVYHKNAVAVEVLTGKNPEELTELEEENQDSETRGSVNEEEAGQEVERKNGETTADAVVVKSSEKFEATATSAVTTFQLSLADVSYILNALVNSVIKEEKIVSTVNDVINFIVTNEESPTDSLAEFEDMENIISTSSSVMADLIDSVESQAELESLPEEEEEGGAEAKEERRTRKRPEPMFKVTIATAAKKEIFINYSSEYSSMFNTSAESELCNSYIKTDEVNDDFESMSSDNFYSVANSLNSSFCSVEDNPGAEPKSPRSLTIIQEVDEGDSSASSNLQ